MIYIFTILSILCVICLFIETELQKCSVTYQNGELKIIKRRNGQVVYRKIFKGTMAKIIYFIFF